MTSLLLLLAIVAFVAGFFIPSVLHSPTGTTSTKGMKGGLKGAGAILFVVALAGDGYYQVPAGYVGIMLQQGAVHGSLDAGPHFVMPFIQKVDLMEVRTQKEEAQAAAASRDLQNVSTHVAINYHVNPLDAANLYKNVGPNFAVRIIDPAVQETVKSVVAKYTAEELIRNRQTVKNDLDAGLAKRLAPYSLVIEEGGVSLKDFQFSEAFNNAIESKQVAQQTAEKAKYLLQQAEIDAKTKVTEAKGAAESNRIRAQALNASGGSRVLAQQWIDKWDGKLPTISSGNGNMMLDISKLIAESPAAKPQ